jgi:hypothetical protein
MLTPEVLAWFGMTGCARELQGLYKVRLGYDILRCSLMSCFNPIQSYLPVRSWRMDMVAFNAVGSCVLDRHAFRKNLEIGKKDFAAIEYLIRKGRRQLEIYSSPGIRNVQR